MKKSEGSHHIYYCVRMYTSEGSHRIYVRIYVRMYEDRQRLSWRARGAGFFYRLEEFNEERSSHCVADAGMISLDWGRSNCNRTC